MLSCTLVEYPTGDPTELEYDYDANGNRETKAVTTFSTVTHWYENDAADKLLKVRQNNSTGTILKEFTYDAAGRVTDVYVPGTGTTSLDYNYEDNVTGITYPSSSTNTFTYNAFGARVSKSDSTGNFDFLRSGTSVTSPVLSDGAATYTPGVSERRGSTTKYNHADIKNNLQQTGSSQTISASKKYDAFGNVTSSSGTWNGPFSYGGKFGYQSDADSGLMLLGHRMYDASTGRFLSRDQKCDGRNWYVYVGSSPITGYDPSGEAAPLVVVAVKVVGALAALYSAYQAYKVIYGGYIIVQDLNAIAVENDTYNKRAEEMDPPELADYHERVFGDRPADAARVGRMAWDVGSEIVDMIDGPTTRNFSPPWDVKYDAGQLKMGDLKVDPRDVGRIPWIPYQPPARGRLPR